MSQEIILQLIIAVSQFCQTYHTNAWDRKVCFDSIWQCGHKVEKSTNAVPFETHNCLTGYMKNELTKGTSK